MTFVMKRVWDQQQRAHSVKNEIADEEVTRGTKGLSREAPADDELDRRRSHVATGIVERILAWAETQPPRVKQRVELRLQGIDEPEAAKGGRLVSEPNKIDPASALTLVEKVLAEELAERAENMSDADVEKDLRQAGVDPARIPSDAELLARAEGRAAEERDGANEARSREAPRVVALAERRRTRWVLMLGGMGAASRSGSEGRDPHGTERRRLRLTLP